MKKEIKIGKTKPIGLEIIDLPKGIYVGDPGSVLPEKVYNKIITDYHDGPHYDDDGHLIAVTRSIPRGDGNYPVRINTEDYIFPVDSGLFGIVNLEFSTKRLREKSSGVCFPDPIEKVDFYFFLNQFLIVFKNR